MGRRHLSGLAALAVAIVLTAPASAGVHWRELARGSATGAAPAAPVAFLALDRAAAARFSTRLPAAGRSTLARVDFSRDAVVAVVGEFGCKDHRIAVVSVARRGAVLVVSLVERALAPGTMECQALFSTYRLLAISKRSLGRPYPTRAEARLARA